MIINICENCKDLHKCKKTGDNKDSCRQGEIDQLFRAIQKPAPDPVPAPKQEQPQKPVQKPDALKDSLSKDIPVFRGNDKI